MAGIGIQGHGQSTLAQHHAWLGSGRCGRPYRLVGTRSVLAVGRLFVRLHGGCTRIGHQPLRHEPRHGTGRNGQLPVAKVYTKELLAAEVKQNFEAIRGRYGI